MCAPVVLYVAFMVFFFVPHPSLLWWLGRAVLCVIVAFPGYHHLFYCNEAFQIISHLGYFWQFTDLHWDFSYATAHLSCNRKNVSDRGPYGDYLCDSPWDLIQETIKQAEMIKPDVDFIAWTGFVFEITLC